MLYGFDVSHANGAIDYQAVAQAGGQAFMFAKCSEGANYPDPLFDQNISGASQVGLITGAYHFLHPNQDINQQADFFVSRAWGKVNLPLMVDFEVTDGESPSQAIDRAGAMLAALQARTGKVAGIYLGENFWNNYPSSFAASPLWIESYHPIVNGQIVDPKIPPPWTDWTFHQFAADPFPNAGIAAGSVAGISGAVDQSRFAGSMSALCSLCDNPPLWCAGYPIMKVALGVALGIGAKMLLSGGKIW